MKLVNILCSFPLHNIPSQKDGKRTLHQNQTTIYGDNLRPNRNPWQAYGGLIMKKVGMVKDQVSDLNLGHSNHHLVSLIQTSAFHPHLQKREREEAS